MMGLQLMGDFIGISQDLVYGIARWNIVQFE